MNVLLKNMHRLATEVFQLRLIGLSGFIISVSLGYLIFLSVSLPHSDIAGDSSDKTVSSILLSNGVVRNLAAITGSNIKLHLLTLWCRVTHCFRLRKPNNSDENHSRKNMGKRIGDRLQGTCRFRCCLYSLNQKNAGNSHLFNVFIAQKYIKCL